MSFYDERIRSRSEPPWGRGKYALFYWVCRNFQEGQLIRITVNDSDGNPAGKNYRILKIYPFFICCARESGFIECFHYLDISRAERIEEKPARGSRRGGRNGL